MNWIWLLLVGELIQIVIELLVCGDLVHHLIDHVHHLGVVGEAVNVLVKSLPNRAVNKPSALRIVANQPACPLIFACIGNTMD